MDDANKESPLEQLKTGGRDFDPAVRQAVVAMGPSVIPALMELVENEKDLGHIEAPGRGWPPAHAAYVLIELKAMEAIPALVNILATSEVYSIIHELIAEHIWKLGPALLEPLLNVARTTKEPQVRTSCLLILTRSGAKDERLFHEISLLFEEDPIRGAQAFGHYGDPRALPVLSHAILNAKRDTFMAYAKMPINFAMDAYERISPPLPDNLRAHYDSLKADADREKFALKAKGTGRNDPCPCGSGKKYKKCCLEKVEKQVH
jgi:hypothetical protein